MTQDMTAEHADAASASVTTKTALFTESQSREKFSFEQEEKRTRFMCVGGLPADGLKKEGKGAQGGEKERYRTCTSCKDYN